jgi:hypothetical protein
MLRLGQLKADFGRRHGGSFIQAVVDHTDCGGPQQGIVTRIVARIFVPGGGVLC